jgi:hypothetical protein
MPLTRRAALRRGQARRGAPTGLTRGTDSP